MNNIIKVGKTDYKFHFGMRVFWYVTNSGEIEFDEVDGRISSDYDSFLRMFVLANESALKKSEGEKLTIEELEFAIDENPDLMIELQKAFQNSSVVEKLQEKTQQEAGNEKKPNA